MMVSRLPKDDVDRFCLGCSYDLRGLAENRCPECGRRFDPYDNSTFSSSRRRKRSAVTLAMYMLPLVLNFVLTVDAGGAGLPMEIRLTTFLQSLCGPFAWALIGDAATSMTLALIVAPLAWLGWLVVVFRSSRLSRMPYHRHLLLALAWCLLGLPPAALRVT